MLEFFEGRSILLTGATGFVGKAVLEKILRCLTGIHAVYILIRDKRGESSQSRLIGLLDNPLFDRVRHEQVEFSKKIIPVNGCLTKTNFGLSKSDLEAILENVSIVIHSAANVNFEVPLSEALRDNVFGTTNIVNICKDISNFAALVHVSTAYTNCDVTDENIKEEVYPVQGSRVNILDPETCSLDTSLGSKPNSYVYSKAIGENVLQGLAKEYNLPCCIVRPSIVGSSWKQPIAGWLHGYGGFNGSLLAILSGLLNIVYSKPKIVVDLIPVDVVANVVIAAAWSIATEESKFKVYNVVSGPFTTKTLKEHMNSFLEAARSQFPSENAVFYPEFELTSSKMWWYVGSFWKQQMPALFIDTVTSLHAILLRLLSCMPFVTNISNDPAKLLKLQKRIIRVQQAQRYFTVNQWSFDVGNVTALEAKIQQVLSPRLDNEWTLTTRNLDWNLYMRSFCLGVRRYLAKEPDSSIPSSLERIQRLKLIRRLLRIFVCSVIFAGLLVGIHYGFEGATLCFRQRVYLNITHTVLPET